MQAVFTRTSFSEDPKNHTTTHYCMYLYPLIVRAYTLSIVAATNRFFVDQNGSNTHQIALQKADDGRVQSRHRLTSIMVYDNAVCSEQHSILIQTSLLFCFSFIRFFVRAIALCKRLVSLEPWMLTISSWVEVFLCSVVEVVGRPTPAARSMALYGRAYLNC